MSDDKFSIFVGNTHNVSVSLLRTLFSSAGPIKNVPVDKGGYMFVEFFEAKHAVAAIKMFNKYVLNGKPLICNPAADSKSVLMKTASMLGLSLDQPDSNSSEPWANVTVGDAVQNAVSKFNVQDHYDVIATLKSMLDEDPKSVSSLLEKHPSLSFAILDIMRRNDYLSLEGSNETQTSSSMMGASIASGGGGSIALPPMPERLLPPAGPYVMAGYDVQYSAHIDNSGMQQQMYDAPYSNSMNMYPQPSNTSYHPNMQPNMNNHHMMAPSSQHQQPYNLQQQQPQISPPQYYDYNQGGSSLHMSGGYLGDNNPNVIHNNQVYAPPLQNYVPQPQGGPMKNTSNPGPPSQPIAPKRDPRKR